MSGITPLLDTLLHQVLGKRVDTPPVRDLNQPVKPTSPAEAPKALHSDSRLDARSNSPALPELSRTSRERSGATSGPMPPQGHPPASAQTHFSTSARTIADLLVRFPAPPSVVTTAVPLLTHGQIPDPTVLATRLEDSIRQSGLFYESHLARWYKGKLPRQQLEREPQMWRSLNFTPSGGGHGANSSNNLGSNRHSPFLLAPLFSSRTHSPAAPHPTNVPASSPQSQPAANAAGSGALPTQAVPTHAPATGGEDKGVTPNSRETLLEPSSRSSQAIHESLQGIVRHQLEMLVTPALRWEGDVWSGLFMALMIQVPPGHQDRTGGEKRNTENRDAEQQGWRSEIDLNIAGLGRVKASLWMQAHSVEIELNVAQELTRRQLEGGIESLRSRLAGHGFEEIRIDLNGPVEGQLS